MKKVITLFALMLFTAVAVAQPQGGQMGKFDPNQFKADMHKFIAAKAQLTEEEQTAFFPLFDEMKDKERSLFTSQRKIKHRPQTDEEYREAINQYDKIDVAQKNLQRVYHQKFLKVLPAKKVFWVIRAEDGFRTQMLRNMARARHKHDFKNQTKK
ncbi:MAG: hypothetical protein Q4F34_01705 [Prevotellaceae bacterium]|nr:hypothetical protein [Prevotellaceae bacterium]